MSAQNEKSRSEVGTTTQERPYPRLVRFRHTGLGSDVSFSKAGKMPALPGKSAHEMKLFTRNRYRLETLTKCRAHPRFTGEFTRKRRGRTCVAPTYACLAWEITFCVPAEAPRARRRALKSTSASPRGNETFKPSQVWLISLVVPTGFEPVSPA